MRQNHVKVCARKARDSSRKFILDADIKQFDHVNI